MLIAAAYVPSDGITIIEPTVENLESANIPAALDRTGDHIVP